MIDILNLHNILGDLNYHNGDYSRDSILNPITRDVHITTKGDQTLVEIEVPGAKPSDVDISANGDLIEISWKRSIAGKSEKHQRNIRISKEIDRDNIQAKVEDGILRIDLTKGKSYGTRKILVS